MHLRRGRLVCEPLGSSRGGFRALKERRYKDREEEEEYSKEGNGESKVQPKDEGKLLLLRVK